MGDDPGRPFMHHHLITSLPHINNPLDYDKRDKLLYFLHHVRQHFQAIHIKHIFISAYHERLARYSRGRIPSRVHRRASDRSFQRGKQVLFKSTRQMIRQMISFAGCMPCPHMIHSMISHLMVPHVQQVAATRQTRVLIFLQFL